MLYWIFFIIISLFLGKLSLSRDLSVKYRICFRISLILFIAWFAGFRDGLGQDYLNYANFLNVDYMDYWKGAFYIEPLFSIFQLILSSTRLSVVFFFTIMALITNYLLIKSFYRYEFTFYIILIYLMSGIYFGSFNLVRQACAVAFFVYSTKYIEEKMPLKYIGMILLASTIHLSALFLLPFYFIATQKISKLFSFILLIGSFLLGWIIEIDLNSLFSHSIFYYDYYFNRDESMTGSGLFTYSYNVIMFILILNKERIVNNKRNNIAFNLAIIGVTLLNFVPSLYYLFRFAAYFQIFIIIITPMLIKIHNKKLVKSLIILVYSFVFLYFITSNSADKLIVPDKMLPLSSIIK